jgi:hypothetical protein
LDPTEKLTIETPEQILLEFPMAGIGSRGLALSIDTIIQAIAVLVVILVVALVDPDLSRSWVGAWNWVQAVELFLFFCLYWATSQFSRFCGMVKPQANDRSKSGSSVPVADP